jgi:hypothetical protein
MFQIIALSALILAVAYAQQHTCMYAGGPNGQFTLNLTIISDWTLELETSEYFAYYTPCGNRMHCRQGNSDFYANVAQYKQGVNGCAFYLSVDHRQPPTYSFGGASWHFRYEDGETCQQKNAPRTTDIYYHCNEEQHSPAHLYNFEEYSLCEYRLNMHSTLACVPENQFNSNCQFRYPNGTGGYYTVDLSSLKGQVLRAPLGNGYEMYTTPCANGLHCYQQYHEPVMSIIENHVTGTCDHILSIWEDGRVNPRYHGDNPDQVHWSFHYYNGQKCSNGQDGEETVRYYCDPTADPPTVINGTSDGDCRWEMNIATKFACNAMEDIIITAKAIY